MATTGEPFGLFWDSENGDRTYSAASFEYWLKKFFTSGVFNGDLQVKAKSGMTLEIDPGYANVDGKVKFWNGAFTVTLDAANSTYPRIDTIVIRRDNVNRQIICEKVTGSYSADTPQPTAPTRNSEIYDLVTAQIYVGAGVTEITQSNITDTRPNNELCGYITGTVEELDFSAFTAQFEAYFAEFKRNQMADFQAWEVAQQAAYAAWFSLVQQQQVQDKANWDAWYAALQEELHELPEDTAEYLQIEIDEIRTSGTTGSILKITTTETSLEGKTVTVTNGTETRTATFDENLECLIAGYKGTGEVTISSSDGIQTASTVVTIPYFGNYQYAIAFWAATVNIQGDDNLKGATITVKDSDDLTVGTVVLNVITGRGVFTAQKADTYTFNFTYQGTDYSESLIVDEQITYSLSLSAGFDWKGWVDTARFLDSTDYNSLDEVLADEEAVRELCLEHACVDYLASVPSVNADIETVINNDLFAKWANNSDYSLDILGANVAIKALMDTADKYGYGEWVLVGQVPKMTSNSAPYGTVICDSEMRGAYYAFDGDSSQNWNSRKKISEVNNNVYVGYVSTSPIVVKKAMIKLDIEASAVIKIQGSNTGNTDDWHDISEQTSIPNDGVIHDIDCSSNSTAYSYHRALYVSETASNPTIYAGRCFMLQFYAWQPKGNVPVMTANNAPYGEAYLSGTVSNPAYIAFNGDVINSCTASGAQSLTYKFTNPVNVKRIKWIPYQADGSQTFKAHTVTFYGSNDNSTWTTLGSKEVAVTDKTNELTLDIPNNTDYFLYYKATPNQANAGNYTVFCSLQYYGRELSVSVPTMTSNTTPYGEAIATSEASSSYLAFKAFDGNDNDGHYFASNATNNGLGYDFGKPISVRKVRAYINVSISTPSDKTIIIQGSNDRFVNDINNVASFVCERNTASSGVQRNIITDISDETPYRYWRVFCSEVLHVSGSWAFAFFTLQFYGLDYSEKEFEEGTTKKWLYDHGVELETIYLNKGNEANNANEKQSNQIVLKTNYGGAGGNGNVYSMMGAKDIDFSQYDLLRCAVGNLMVHVTSQYASGNIFAQLTVVTDLDTAYPDGGSQYQDHAKVASIDYLDSAYFPNNIALDVSALNGIYDVAYGVIYFSGNHISSIKEMWLE